MTENLPAPPIAADVDLTDFGFMPLDVRRLRDSKLAASVDGEQFRCAVLLWCASWHQLPAGSLPDDDIELANLAGFGRMVPQWKKVRAGALYGWTKCSDGRLYHAVVTEKALEAWKSKLDSHYRRECDRLRKENKRRQENKEAPVRIPSFEQWNSERRAPGIPTDVQRNSGGNPADVPRKSKGRPADSVLKGQGQGEVRDRDMCIPPENARPPESAGSQNPAEPPTEDTAPSDGNLGEPAEQRVASPSSGDGGLPSNPPPGPTPTRTWGPSLTLEQAEELQRTYPVGIYRQSDWLVTEKLINGHLANGVEFETILASFERYRLQCEAKDGIGTQFVQSPVKHCDRECPQFDEPFPLPRTKAEARQDANIDAGLEWLQESARAGS